MLVAKNRLEEKVLEMIRNGEKPKGWAFDIWMDMTLRAKEEEEKEDK